ncbi:MAG: hypothetical protein SGILL_009715 [Bacillariaceae sp.]
MPSDTTAATVVGTSTSFGGKSKRCVVARRIHKVFGWIGVCLLSFISVQGSWLAFKYTRGGGSAQLPAIGVGGIACFFMIWAAVYAVKIKKDKDLHKDIVVALMTLIFIGTGFIREVETIMDALLGPDENDYESLSAILPAALLFVSMYAAICIAAYWRAGRLKNRAYGKKLILFLVVLPSIGMVVGACSKVKHF